MEGVHVILATTPSAMGTHPTGSVKDVNLCTSFTFTRRSPREELKTRTSSWFGRPPIVKNDKSLMSSQALKLEMNHEFSTDDSPISSRPHGCHPWRSCPAGTDQQVTPGIPVETSARDWGDLDHEDKTENELSVKYGLRLLSSYQVTETEKLWVITEADRSVTTLLLPEEY
jgi:hypothetical protein